MDATDREAAKEPRRRTRRAMDDYTRPRRPWLLVIASLLLAGLAAWTGFQWRQGTHREVELRAELKQVYVEAEQLRAQAVQAQQRVSLLEKQVMALSAEHDATTKRLKQLETQLRAATTQRPRSR